ncbi:MAG: DUF5752 family protein [Methylobacter sp.]|uniref:DUF5752 family protein n=1 Tax=Methylobacter sp. TaxID=2051955 RepID=UPI002730AEFC|nr:DUF5752 family protein [Methylobacter sp.]MDP1666549.1 DUF5752 family protein [Methylobacter sp.]
MNTINTKPEPEIPHFVLKDCALIAIATHRRANTLKEFRDHIASLNPDSLYYHFWANLLLPHFEEREYINDFASWMRHGLSDTKLAEQLAVLDPTSFNDLEELRYHLLEYIDDRMEESEYLQWTRASQQFEFIRSQIVVFDTHTRISEPHEMSGLIALMSASSIFYHFIDARRRAQDKMDDFCRWLTFFGETYQPLIVQLSGIDPYFSTLVELRQQVATAFQNHFTERVS